MRKPQHDDKVLALLESEAEPMHYYEVHKRLHITEEQANQSCNRLVKAGLASKVRNGIFSSTKTEGSSAPWDTSPQSRAQHEYIGNQLRDITKAYAANRRSVDTTTASTIIDRLNSVRRMYGIPFKEYKK